MSVMVHQKALNFKPGEKFLYSNTGFTLLALVVKRVSGMSLREYTTKNIFEPLGMKNTHFRDDHEEVIKHDALGYEQDGDGKPYRMSLTNFDTTGATSLHTTVEDLQLWDENFYNPRVGGPEFVKQMIEPGRLNSGKEQDYASGLAIGTYKGLPTVGHGGADAGYRSDIVRFPQQHFTATALCNRADANPGALTRQVADIVLAKDIKEPAAAPAATATKPAGTVTLTAEQMKAVAGTYWKQDDNDYQRIVLKDGALQLDFGGDEYHPLNPVAESHFRIAGVPWTDHMDLHFLEAAGGKPAKLEQSWDGGKPDVYEWVQAVDPAPAQLTEYSGAYVSDEIDPVYRMEVRDGRLALLRMKSKPDLLRPTVQDVFVGQIGTLRFTRDAKHRVTGFVLDAGRIQGFQFKRQTGVE